MSFTKLIGGLISSALTIGALVGIPGLDSPDVAAMVEKVAATASGLLTGWLFLRQEWLGQGKQPQAPKSVH